MKEINIKKKKLYPILTILVLVVLCTMALLFIGCFEDPEIKMNREMAKQIREQEEAKAEEAEQLAIDKQVRQDEAEQLALDEAVDQMEREEWEEEEAEEETPAEEAAEEEVVAEEEEKLISNEPITYSGDIEGLAVILIVDFKTTEVKGSLRLSGEDYIDAAITGSIIDIDTFEINTNYSGIYRSEEAGQEAPFNGIITGNITDDLSTFNGIILPDYEDSGIKFTATK